MSVVRKMLNFKNEQRVNLKFLVKLNKTATECLKMMSDVYREDCMSRARVFEWHKRFTEDRIVSERRPTNWATQHLENG